jgi:hypothetical protein
VDICAAVAGGYWCVGIICHFCDDDEVSSRRYDRTQLIVDVPLGFVAIHGHVLSLYRHLTATNALLDDISVGDVVEVRVMRKTLEREEHAAQKSHKLEMMSSSWFGDDARL